MGRGLAKVVVAAFVVGGLCGFAVVSHPPRPHPPVARRYAAEAERAYLAMRSRYARAGGFYADRGGRLAEAWPVSQALAASLAVAPLPGRGTRTGDARQTIAALAHYRLGAAYASRALPPLADGHVRFYDDNEWLAQDFLAGYRVLRQHALLRRAEGLFGFLTRGWDRDTTHTCSGGMFWADTPAIRDRNTVSTANGAVVALRLYELTGRRAYLDWAKRMYGWVRRCLVAPDGLYADHLDLHGRVTPDEWTYNQGAMVAAGVLLARASGNRRYLDQAEACAEKALHHYAASRYAGEPPIFVAIFFRDLRLLQETRPLPGYDRALRSYVDGDVKLNAAGGFGSSLLDAAASVQLYALAATS